jgi:uncharacterized membrane protein YgaE (UPF0421/DUF939 family)
MTVPSVRRAAPAAGPFPVRLAALSAVAAAVAYALGSALPHVSPVVAGVTALVAIRPTFHASMQEALRQVLGVVVGAAVAFASLQIVGFSALSLLVALLVCLVVAAWLGLGENGALAVAVTVILVVGPTFSKVAVESRLLGVVLGSVLALVTSYFARPGTPHGRALEGLVGEGERIAELLERISTALAADDGRVEVRAARGWLDDAEQILARTAAARDEAEDALAGARWSPMIDRAEAAAVLDQARITERTATTVASMCRDLVTAAVSAEPLPAGLARSLADVLGATAAAVDKQSRSARERPSQTLSDETGPVRLARSGRADAAAHVRQVDDTVPLLLGGSLLRDADEISQILSGR